MDKRKHPRLKDRTIYSNPAFIVHSVIRFDNSSEYHPAAELIIEHLKLIAAEHKIPVYAYSVMPDHIHLLAGQSEDFSTIDFIRLLKGRSSADFRKLNLAVEYQKSFYDHIMRKDEDLVATAKYICANPVRKGITKLIWEHEFSGSLVYNLKTAGD